MKNRKKKLIDPKVQGRLVVHALMCACAAVVLQAGLTAWTLSNFAVTLPNDGQIVLEAIPGALVVNVIFALLIISPVTIFFVVAASFPLFGPMYRFRTFLTGVVRGEHPEPCTLRAKDEFKDMCTLLNEVTEEQRARMQRETRDAA